MGKCCDTAAAAAAAAEAAAEHGCIDWKFMNLEVERRHVRIRSTST